MLIVQAAQRGHACTSSAHTCVGCVHPIQLSAMVVVASWPSHCLLQQLMASSCALQVAAYHMRTQVAFAGDVAERQLLCASDVSCINYQASIIGEQPNKADRA